MAKTFLTGSDVFGVNRADVKQQLSPITFTQKQKDAMAWPFARGSEIVIGSEVTLDTTGTTTVSSAVTQPANSFLVGVGILCTDAFTIASGADLGLNVGTAANGSDSSFVALDADSIYSNATAGLATNAVVSSWGPTGEAGTNFALVANAAVHTTAARSLYFKTTSSSGNPTAGKYKPLLFIYRTA
tara:strand:+ start:351 stop:908 length:558 start_codon:yes stop_codon:yes gene_type:complete